MYTVSYLAVVTTVALLFYCVKSFLTSNRSSVPLPPGPKGKFFVGTLLICQWMESKIGNTGISTETCTVCIPDYHPGEGVGLTVRSIFEGPISSVTVFGTTLIILNDAKLALELMGKRSAIHYARSRMAFGGEMLAMLRWTWTNAVADKANFVL